MLFKAEGAKIGKQILQGFRLATRPKIKAGVEHEG